MCMKLELKHRHREYSTSPPDATMTKGYIYLVVAMACVQSGEVTIVDTVRSPRRPEFGKCLDKHLSTVGDFFLSCTYFDCRNLRIAMAA